MTLSLKKYVGLGLLFAAILATGVLLAVAQQVEARSTYSAPTLVDTFVNYDLILATTTSATSTNNADLQDRTARLDGANKAVFYFSHGGVATTSTAGAKFEVEVSPDGTNWFDYTALKLLDSTLSATTSVTIQGATSTVAAALNLDNFTFHFARCIVNEVGTEGTQGEHTCKLSVEY